MLFTRSFWVDTAERTIRTFAQALIASLGLGQGLLGIDWKADLSIAGGSALVALLLAVAAPATQNRPPQPPAEPPTDPTPVVATGGNMQG